MAREEGAEEEKENRSIGAIDVTRPKPDLREVSEAVRSGSIATCWTDGGRSARESDESEPAYASTSRFTRRCATERKRDQQMAPTKAKTSKSAAAKRVAKPNGPRAKPAAARMSLAEAMTALEKAGSEQTRKTYRRHGAPEPLFGVSFATLAALVKRIGVDHELARALWNTGNYDARILAFKIADPARVSPAELDRWAREVHVRSCGGYVAMLAAESPHAAAKAAQWLAAPEGPERSAGWSLLSQMAMLDASAPDALFLKRLAEIEASIHNSPNAEREAMNYAVISIGCRNAALRKAALAAAKRIGKVDVDHGDTSCKTPDAAQYIEKSWAHSTSKGFESPAAHERSRERKRIRC